MIGDYFKSCNILITRNVCMSMDYWYEVTYLDIFDNYSDKFRSYFGPSCNSGTEYPYEAPKKKLKIKHMVIKYSVYILTPKDHKKVIDIVKIIYKFKKKIPILFNSHMKSYITSIDVGRNTMESQ